MIDYETYWKIMKLHAENLRVAQIAGALGLDERTVLHWTEAGAYKQRKSAPRASKLDVYKPEIIRWLETYPYSSVQIFQRLRENGYAGGITIVKDYVQKVRPRPAKGFLTLTFAPGECAQVDWGQYGTVSVGSTRRRLSFFVMVLCYSRMMYVEFTVSESMEHFLDCHQNAFHFFGAVPGSIMVDNLKCAVIRRLVGLGPVFNPRYQDFANHYGFEIRACSVGKGNEKGRVENGVGYVKKNFLAGLEIPNFSSVNAAARHWLEQTANVRIHGATHQQPVALYPKDKEALRPLPVMPYDVATVRPIRANNRFRVTLDTNRYSVPAEYASAAMTLKAHPDRICLYHDAKLIAQHTRSYDRHQDFEDPDHPKALLQQRKRAKEQRIVMRFLALSKTAETYYRELAKRRMNPEHHIRKIVALAEIYGTEKVARALEDTCTFQAFSSEYVANLLEQRDRVLPEPSALHLTRRHDLLELEIPEPNLAIYDLQTNPPEGETAHEHQAQTALP
jgi:transposase